MLESGFYNMDCMDAMREFPDNFFELAIVDPPYVKCEDGIDKEAYCTEYAMIKSMPPVEPKRPKGEWVEFRKPCYDGTSYYWKKCSVCDHDMIGYETNFCPNCGADMRGEE